MSYIQTPLGAGIDGDSEEAPAQERQRKRRWSQRLLGAAIALLVMVTVGGVSVYVTGDGEYSFWESVYFSLITVSTVGYGELPHLQNHPGARLVSAATIVGGLIVLAYLQSTITALFLEGSFSRAFRRRKMDKQIAALKDHVILVGCGRVGQYVAAELHRSENPFVIIERNADAVHHLEHELKRELLYIDADANEDDVLLLAGIERAKGLVTTLGLDRDNLFITLTARTMNAQLRIISKVVNSQNENKLLRAGASLTVSPQQIGGLRLASAVAAPHVTEFMEHVLSLPQGIRLHEISVGEGSRFASKPLRDAGLRAFGNLLVVALKDRDGFHFNPGPDQMVAAGCHLIVLGHAQEVERLRNEV